MLVDEQECGSVPTPTETGVDYTVTCTQPIEGTTVKLMTTQDEYLHFEGIYVYFNNEYEGYTASQSGDTQTDDTQTDDTQTDDTQTDDSSTTTTDTEPTTAECTQQSLSANCAVFMSFEATPGGGVMNSPYCLGSYVANSNADNCPVTYTIVDDADAEVANPLISLVDDKV